MLGWIWEVIVGEAIEGNRGSSESNVAPRIENFEWDSRVGRGYKDQDANQPPRLPSGFRNVIHEFL